MNETFEIDIAKTVPSEVSVLKAQGIPDATNLNDKTASVLAEALGIYKNLARPRGIIKDIFKDQFRSVYYGEGDNEEVTPLDSIYKYADNLALFAVTIGQEVCFKIQALFDANDFALASMLDATASEAAENGAIYIEQQFANRLRDELKSKDDIAVSRFSPGYCGWHVSGQKKLFGLLNPGQINITLNNSCLMTPIKSISGVLVAGEKELFEFSNDFLFCSECADSSCLSRVLSYPEKNR